MRTLYTKIFLWLLFVAVSTIAGVIGTTFYLARRLPGPGDTITRLRTYEMNEARRIFETRGPEGLRIFLSRLDDYFPGDRHLLDAWGRDLATGEDMQSVVQYARTPRSWWRRLQRSDEPIALVYPAPDGKYLWLVEHLPPSTWPPSLHIICGSSARWPSSADSLLTASSAPSAGSIMPRSAMAAATSRIVSR